MLNGTHALDGRSQPWCGNKKPHYTTTDWTKTTCNACLEAAATCGHEFPIQILKQHKLTQKELEIENEVGEY